MRSPFVIAVNVDALRIEVGDLRFATSRAGVAPEELAKVDAAINHLKSASEFLKNYRFIKSVEDLPETAEKPKSMK